MGGGGDYKRNLMNKEKNKYSNYLKSSKWKSTREKFFQTSRYRCFICRVRKNLHLHHKRYSRYGVSIIGKEQHNDFRWLCEDCHKKIHKYHLEKDLCKMTIRRIDFKRWFAEI